MRQQKLEDIISSEAMRGLIAAYPGIEIDIPSRVLSLNVTHWLVKACGLADATKLVETFGGTRIYVPKLYALERAIRNKAIIEKYSAGAKVKDLAREYDLTQRAIEMVLAKGVEDNLPAVARIKAQPLQNLDLFD